MLALLAFAGVLAGCTATLDGQPSEANAGSGSVSSGGTTGSGGTGAASQGAGPSTGGASGTGGSGGAPSDTTNSGIHLNGAPAYYRFVRLTHEQWEASARDLLRLSALPGLSGTFTSDPPDGTFSNNERALFVTSGLHDDYQRAAETLATEVTGDAQALARITGGTTDAATFVRTFGRRAYRRPLTQEEETRYQALFASGAMHFASGNAFTDGVHVVLEAMLQSPHFVYRSELGADRAPLSGYEMASKLSFLLRNTTPDDALLDAAGAGELDSSAGVAARAAAMLDAPTAREVLKSYHSELFGLFRYSSIDKNRTAFPAYNDALNAELEQADSLFFDDVFAQARGLRAILTSPAAFVSPATAAFYGVTAPAPGLSRIELGSDRPGFFTRVGFLALNGTLNDPDPIHRGVDIINRLMCAELAPPPGIIPALPATMTGQTNRQRVNAHTGPGTCGEGCHSTIINPIGFAFENFDALGQARSIDNGNPIDTTGEVELSGGIASFAGAPELLALLADAAQVHGCYARHLAEFTLARDIAGADRALIDRLEQTSKMDDASIKAIVLAILADPSFLTRSAGAP